MPWPDEIMAHICSVLHQNDEDTKSKRRTVGRYIIVSMILAYSNMSAQIVRLFPNLNKLRELQLITMEEQIIFDSVDGKDVLYEIPIQWIHEILRSKLNSTQSPLVFSLNTFRNQLRTLTYYNEIPFPLIIGQTATIQVCGLIFFAYIGNVLQEWQGNEHTVFPFLVLLRFVYTVGWLKVAEDLRNPFGDDDDDVELAEWFDRHIRFVHTLTTYSMDKMPKTSWTSNEAAFENVMAHFTPFADEKRTEHFIQKNFKKVMSIFVVTQ